MVQEAHLEVREGSGGQPGGSGVVGRPRLRSGRGGESLLDPLKVQVGLGGLPEGLGWVGWPTRRSGRIREANPNVWEGSKGQPKGSGEVRRPR